mmetsp:Transcript_57051/g.90405  ORF Transcript_57051/g.90405 Transcript_57051/m.90405 type:complete len:492 (+) Transcript_57051:31-1506(+)
MPSNSPQDEEQQNKDKDGLLLSPEQLQLFLDNQQFEYATGEAADIILSVGDEGDDCIEIRFTRFLLCAQSPVFRRMLHGAMSESEQFAIIRVKFPEVVVRQMLMFVSNARLVMDVNTVVDLYCCADFYGIELLRVAADEFIASNLSSETATGFLAAAHQRRLEDLEARCMKYVYRHALHAFAGGRVAKLSEQSLLDLVKSEALNLSELEIFRSVVQWAKANLPDDTLPEELKDKLAGFMSHVRFPLISGPQLAEEIYPTQLVDEALLVEALVSKFQKEPTLEGTRFQMRSGYRRVLIESDILDDAMKTTLGEMLPMKRLSEISFRLIHDSNRGRDAASFDSAVRGMGPTLTLIRERDTKYVFGAYIADTYGLHRSWVPGNPENFLFTLGNITGKPAKLTRSANCSSGWHDGCGLHVGQGDLIAFCSHTCTSSSFTSFCKGYSGKIDNSLLSGTPGPYVPDLMEVFAVSGMEEFGEGMVPPVPKATTAEVLL